jgi:predicted Abi (CAAX) family protease
LSLARRLWRSLTTWPDARGWLFAVMASVLTLIVMAIVGGAGGLLHLRRPDIAGLPLRLVTAFFIPSLGEEALFRGLLVPDRSETRRPWTAIIVATALFTAWHALETTFLHHAAPTFLRADFLICAAMLGAGCAISRWRTGSLWPAVILHWMVVVAWQTWLGGPRLASLR